MTAKAHQLKNAMRVFATELICGVLDHPRGRQCGPVVRALALRSGDSGFKTHSDHSLNLFLVVHGSTSQLHLTNRFHVAVRLFSNRSQMTSKCGKIDPLKLLPEKRSFEGKYASFKNIKFPRGNYQTDSSET